MRRSQIFFATWIRKTKISNGGFTLASVLIAAALASIISLVVVQIIETSRKAQATNEISFAKLEFIRNIEAQLANSTKQVCESTLITAGTLSNFDKDNGDAPLVIDQIVTGGTAPEVLFQTGAKDNTGTLVIERMQLIKFQDNGASDPFNGFGIFEISIQKLHSENSLGGEFLKPRLMVLRMQLWASGPDAGKTFFCTPATSSDDSIWEANGDGRIFYKGGNVGIGTNTPVKALQVMGDIDVSPEITTGTGGRVWASAFYHLSDLALKEDIRKIDGLNLVRQLRGVMFKWKSSGNTDLGVIAQEVERIIPYIVERDANSKFATVNYDSLIAVLIEAVKSLDKRNDLQDARLKVLEEKLKEMGRY